MPTNHRKMAAAASPLAGKLENIVELKHSADKFFQVLSTEIHHLPNASSDKIQTIEVHEGDWETPNSIKLWNYTIDGKQEIFKEKVEVDETSRTVSLVAIEGHVVEKYKSYKLNMKVVPKDGGGSGFVEMSVDYEKLKSDDPPPSDYFDFAISVVKDIDAHIPNI